MFYSQCAPEAFGVIKIAHLAHFGPTWSHLNRLRGRIVRHTRAVRIVGDSFAYECGCHNCAYQGRLHYVPSFVDMGELSLFSCNQ